MGEWTTVPDFTTGQVVRIDTFQDIWTNVFNLKNPRYEETQFIAGTSYTTGSTSFVDVDNVNIALSFESFGGDFMVGLFVKSDSSTSGTGVKLRFELDGVGYGNTNGQMNMQNLALQGFAQSQLIYIFTGIAAGEHTIILQFAANPSGTASEYVSPGDRYVFWKVEF